MASLDERLLLRSPTTIVAFGDFCLWRLGTSFVPGSHIHCANCDCSFTDLLHCAARTPAHGLGSVSKELAARTGLRILSALLYAPSVLTQVISGGTPGAFICPCTDDRLDLTVKSQLQMPTIRQLPQRLVCSTLRWSMTRPRAFTTF